MRRHVTVSASTRNRGVAGIAPSWRLLKRAVHERDGYIYQQTGVVAGDRAPHPQSAVADHIKPHRGNPKLFWDIDNIQTVSKDYHDSVKQRIEREQERGAGQISEIPSRRKPAPPSFGDFFSMDWNFDVLGDSIAEGFGKRRRPEHIRTDENRIKIRMLLAFGRTNFAIARALRVTRPTLNKHYFYELRRRDEARPALKSAAMTMIHRQASDGNVAAQKELSRLSRRTKLRRSEKALWKNKQSKKNRRRSGRSAKKSRLPSMLKPQERRQDGALCCGPGWRN